MTHLGVTEQAVLAALWLAGLWYAAPLLHGGPRTADRLRDAIVIGVAIPFLLAFVHLFYWPACWAALVLCIAGAMATRTHRESGFREPIPYVLIAALALVAWPQLVRPPLDGDTLSYHLPNAAAWAHAHSIWTTQTRYWWYPPASELFAGALYAISTPFAVGWSGLAALSLLGFRVYAWAREGAHLPNRFADVFAAAVAGILPLALQSGTMQNDVWLAAFFAEILWSAPVDDVTAIRAAAICALVKPDGWIYAAIALAASTAAPRAWFAALGAAALWGIHDAVLWQSAFVPPASTAATHLWRSTMLAHPLATLALGTRAAARFAPFGFLLILVAAASPRLSRDPPLKWASLAAMVAALVMPFGFWGGGPQLATGASLRYFAPAMVAGALVLAPHVRAFARVALWLLLAGAIGEAAAVLAIFVHDAVTLLAIAAACAVPLTIALLRRWHMPWALAAAGAAAVIVTTMLATRHTTRFYADATAVRGQRSGVYAWIERTQPPRVAGWGLRIGAVNVLSPKSLAMDVPDTTACARARVAGAVLVAMAEPTRSRYFDGLRIHDAALCGDVLYRDPIAIAVNPR